MLLIKQSINWYMYTYGIILAMKGKNYLLEINQFIRWIIPINIKFNLSIGI